MLEALIPQVVVRLGRAPRRGAIALLLASEPEERIAEAALLQLAHAHVRVALAQLRVAAGEALDLGPHDGALGALRRRVLPCEFGVERGVLVDLLVILVIRVARAVHVDLHLDRGVGGGGRV